ncbi:DUF1516 family protein [Alkalicoccobacillus porphyridii]|uniref:DUF1516 family protein n=1 Tax=Alkalicoccobacillus porphyridii TaxID=2597270 RepID=A0A553ZXP8_9BACI|nr:DUF1516 family protein [Alkalicoccobacillus porphyridii]TSB46175.1 DUF1516 family protein [Alkalicoccobacillus porphyridii]
MDAQLFLIYYKIHVATWPLILILFTIIFVSNKIGLLFFNRMLRTLLWFLYVLSMLSGTAVLYAYQFPAQYVIKGLISLILIYSMEVILRKTKRKQRGTSIYWFIGFAALSIILLLGFNVGLHS